jgi:fructokinase
MKQVALVVGEALVDVVHRSDGSVVEYAGGSSANAAVALSRLGREVWFDTCFADDAYGAMLSTHLTAAEVHLASDPAAVSRTSSAVATIGLDGAASYVFDIDWRLNALQLPDDVETVVAHASSLGAVLPPGADDVFALLEGLRATATISYDINARPMVTGVGDEVRARIERLVAICDIVKASDEDLEALYPSRSLEQAAQDLLSLGPAVVVITLGGEGAFWVTGSTDGKVSSIPVSVADTIGAGDTFGAALLDALWSRALVGRAQRSALENLPAETWHEIFSYAAGAAAVTVSRPGADPPYRHELD